MAQWPLPASLCTTAELRQAEKGATDSALFPGALLPPLQAIGPIPQVPPPRSSPRFEFDFERDFIAQVEKETAAAAARASAANSTSGGEAQRSSDAFGVDNSSLGEESSRGEGGSGGGASAAGGVSSVSRAMGDAVLSELQQQLEVERGGFGASAMESQGGATQNGIEDVSMTRHTSRI